jgi:hypothetical protein
MFKWYFSRNTKKLPIKRMERFVCVILFYIFCSSFFFFFLRNLLLNLWHSHVSYKFNYELDHLLYKNKLKNEQKIKIKHFSIINLVNKLVK